MPSAGSLKTFTLLQRELQEYRISLVYTPLVIALVLALVMLSSVIFANRISVMGDTFLKVIMQEEEASGLTITINMDDDEIEIVEETGLATPVAPVAPPSPEPYQVERDPAPVDEEDWNFSREWTFKPMAREKNRSSDKSSDTGELVSDGLNPMLNMVHALMLTVLVFVTFHYLLGCLYNDRKDRSILFFKSMPVSEKREVLTRFGVALVVAPAIFIGVSLLAQLACVLLAMLLVWRMDMDPFAVVLANVRFAPLLLNQVGGWLLTALWVAPVYAWLMVASAGARRSPFMLAVAPVVGLILLESIFVGSDFVSSAVFNHLPHYVGGDAAAEHSAVGYYFDGLNLAAQDYIGLLLGLVFAACAIAVAVYLRRYRFDI